MSMFKSAILSGVFTFLFVLCSISAVSGQSTIFNIPSTDVMGEKRFYVEGDFIAHFDKWEKGGFQSFGYRTVYGFRKNFEAGVNFFYTRNGSNSPKEIQFNGKYKIFEKEKYGLAASTGVQFFVPLNKSAGRRAFGMYYANTSKTIKKTRETRVTGGFYTVFGAERDFGRKNGIILGVEQPLFGKLGGSLDWSSGKNRFGYATAGLSYSFTKKQFIQAGYNWGNSGRGNNALSVFYGVTY